jgi:thymidylate synthase
MITIVGRNVEELYWDGMYKMERIGVRSSSRTGDVLVAPCPVMSVYERPQERVLLDHVRRANPFFHLMESLWMLAGRNDATWLDTYIHDFSARFAEPDGTQWGAYGYRWRKPYLIDQLDYTVEAFSKDPNDRRVVIAMWDMQLDLGATDKKDLCCNTHIYPRIVNGRLDLTVCCRSNDIIWGAYGANAVHFSVLQEYLAGRIGVQIGTLYQLSNNWHAYVDVYDKFKNGRRAFLYENDTVKPLAMGNDWRAWDSDLGLFMDWHDILWVLLLENGLGSGSPLFKNKWFNDVAVPMARTWWVYKQKDPTLNPMLEAAEIKASDWQTAARMWLSRTP